MPPIHFFHAITLRTAGALLAAFVAALMTFSAHAEVVISNTPNGTTGGNELSASRWKALQFTTNDRPARINAITLGLNPPGDTPPLQTAIALPAQFNVELLLYSVVNGQPAAQIASTGPQSVNMTQRSQMYSFEVGPGFVLAPNTRYALVIRSDATGIKWGRLGDGVTTPSSFTGYAYNGFSLTENTGATWADTNLSNNAVVIDVTFLAMPVPTLSAWAMIFMASFMALFAAWRLLKP